MIKYKLIPYPNTKFRIGKTDWYDSDDMIHSDTLFSGIVNCYHLLYGNDNTNKLINAFQSGQIKISSLWYGINIKNNNNETEKCIDFFPKPYNIRPPQKNKEDFQMQSAKKAKKIHYVSKETLEYILNSYDAETNTFPVNLLNDNEFNHIGNEFVYTKNEFDYSFSSTDKIKKLVTESKNQIDRNTAQVKEDDVGNGLLFQEIDLQLQSFKENGYVVSPYMFFLTEIADEFKVPFNAAVCLMCDEGIGGERAFGKGIFKDVVDSEYFLFNNKTNQIYILLSLLNPKNELEKLRNSLVAYESLLRGGWSNDSRKKNVRMITEGSVFNTDKLNGELIDVTPDNKEFGQVFQNGLSFFV